LIEAAGLNWFGDSSNKIVKPYIAEIRGEKIAFIGYNEFAYKGLDNVLRAIKDVKVKDGAATTSISTSTSTTSTFVVVYSHWGEEYKLNFNSVQQKTAHAFVDAGADVVIGAHPHVTQPIEIYNNKPIFYSLGNFIFDQAANASTGRGLAVKISLMSNFATYDLFPILISKQQAALMASEEWQKELDRLNAQGGTINLSR
jgi:poly-gamma-glutamate synthesis protein (capsule biosynthesis protein)